MIIICFGIRLRTLLEYATLVRGKGRDWVLNPHRTVVGHERHKKIASLILGIKKIEIDIIDISRNLSLFNIKD
jgi:hypothetical protein